MLPTVPFGEFVIGGKRFKWLAFPDFYFGRPLNLGWYVPDLPPENNHRHGCRFGRHPRHPHRSYLLLRMIRAEACLDYVPDAPLGDVRPPPRQVKQPVQGQGIS